MLKAFHKYLVEIILVCHNKTSTSEYSEMSFPLPDTTFIAVYSYKNPDIANLKAIHKKSKNATPPPLLQSLGM